MVTGSIPAIRFGIILGGTLLALSIASLRSHKKGKTSPVALKGQAGQHVVYFTIEITKHINKTASKSLYFGLIALLLIHSLWQKMEFIFSLELLNPL